TLSPALSSILLKPIDGKRQKFILFRWFDAGFEKLTAVYGATVSKLIKISFALMLVYGIMTFVAIRMFNQLPTGFIPDEDQAAMFINVQLPDGASLARTEEVLKKINNILLPVRPDGSVGRYPGVADVLSSPGFSILTGVNSANNAMIIVALDDWAKRQQPGMSQNEIIGRLAQELGGIQEAVVSPFGVPVIPGVGVSSGFSFVIEDTNGTDPERLQNAANTLVAAANHDPRLQSVFTTFRAAVPQVYLEIDREKALKLGVELNSINSALQGLLGYTYINDLNQFGKVYKVEVQADSEFRRSVDNFDQIFVPNKKGEMVPLATLVKVEDKVGPQYINRYNLYASVNISGSPAPGVSSGDAMKAMEELADKHLPEGMKYDWTDMSYQEKQSQGQVGIVFALALLFIYLFLVAQYESWMIPLSVLLSVPVAFLGALSLLYLMGVDNNLYVQVGLVLLFGIACKTAILIVEFAKVKHEAGMSIVEAAAFAAKLRFRAVLMTAVSFILGTIPLLTASGAGAASRHSLGAAVVGGMFFSIVIGTFMIPAFYVVIQSVTEKFSGKKLVK
ncbi:MAG: efflux RND transporter permease subunit, partial [Victivallaceae bacterium]